MNKSKLSLFPEKKVEVFFRIHLRRDAAHVLLSSPLHFVSSQPAKIISPQLYSTSLCALCPRETASYVD